MTIEALPVDRSPPDRNIVDRSTVDRSVVDRSPKSPESSPAAAVVQTPVASAAAPAGVGDVSAAVAQLQTAISNGPNPDFKLDYLSGLSVVTVRSTITGEVVYQLPDTRALELARMIKDGASVGSVGLFKTTA